MSKKKSKASKKSSAKKSKKPIKKERVEMEPVNNIAEIPTDKSEAQPETKSKTRTMAKKKDMSDMGKGKDENGFTIGSKSSLIYSLLSEGRHTREGILKMLDEKFPGSNNKNTLSTFISDVQKPVGTYSSSRGIKISITEDGVLSIEKVG